MNRFLIGTAIGLALGGLGVWCILASEKDKRTAKKYVKSFIS